MGEGGSTRGGGKEVVSKEKRPLPTRPLEDCKASGTGEVAAGWGHKLSTQPATCDNTKGDVLSHVKAALRAIKPKSTWVVVGEPGQATHH